MVPSFGERRVRIFWRSLSPWPAVWRTSCSRSAFSRSVLERSWQAKRACCTCIGWFSWTKSSSTKTARGHNNGRAFGSWEDHGGSMKDCPAAKWAAATIIGCAKDPSSATLFGQFGRCFG